jgi:proline dehydrogenase
MFKKLTFYLFARRFVAGETIDDAVRVAKELRGKNIYAIINILGEHIKDREEVDRVFRQYIDLILLLAREGLWKCHISVKPSQLGLEISEDLFKEKLETLLATTKIILPPPEGMVEIDAEEPDQAEPVKKICLELTAKYRNFRVCRQANLERTAKDIEDILAAGVSIRLCKGAYPGGIRGEEKLRYIFLAYAESNKQVVAATHDPWLLGRLYSQTEIQVLLGLENKMASGVYVPCGPNWYSYGKRRWKSIVKILWRNWLYKIGRR